MEGTRVIGCVCEGNGPGVYEMLGYLLPIYDGIWGVSFLFFFLLSRPHISLVLPRGMLRGLCEFEVRRVGCNGHKL